MNNDEIHKKLNRIKEINNENLLILQRMLSNRDDEKNIQYKTNTSELNTKH